ncbi:hypothetical protein SO802_005744 [Lithocarpus litseifolius]|uniref:Uncharacterized protein n=1 Tax=Lithocarpus litseifolius TaxID=425828 RepID=A0AAW2DNM9_9ROSI
MNGISGQIDNNFNLSSNAIMFPSKVSGIFSPYFIGFLSFLSWNTDCLGVACIVQAVLCAINAVEVRLLAEMTLQRGRVTLAEILGTPTRPQGQTPPRAATTSTPPPAPLVITVTTDPTCHIRARCDTHVDATGAPTYIKVFMVEGEVLPATNKVRPWKDGRGGKVAEFVRKALLLPEDMKHWAKWDDDTLLLNMKKEAIMAKENTKAITERNEAMEKEVMEVKKALAKKDATLKGYEVAVDVKIQEVYYQGQHDYIDSVKPKESNIPIPEELVIIPNLEIQAIINDESPIREVGGASLVAGSGGEMTSLAAMSTTKEPPRA